MLALGPHAGAGHMNFLWPYRFFIFCFNDSRRYGSLLRHAKQNVPSNDTSKDKSKAFTATVKRKGSEVWESGPVLAARIRKTPQV